MIRPARIALAVTVACLAQQVSADTVVTFKKQNGAAPEKITIHAGMVQMPSPETGMRLVMDTNRQKMLMINDKEKQYMEMDSATIEKTSKLMSQMRQAMMAQMKNLPEAQRKMLEKRMGIGATLPAAPKFTVKSTGKHIKISGIPCEVKEILRDGKPSMEACVASVADTGIDKADYATMKKMFDMSRMFARQSAKMAGSAAGGVASMPNLDGVPLEVKDMEHGRTVTVATIDSKVKLADKDFQIGPGYKKIDPFQQMQQHMGHMPAPPR